MIELVEYQTATLALTHPEARELAHHTRGVGSSQGRPRVIERLTPAAAPGTYEIQPGPYVGRFQLRSGRIVDVASRFPFHDLTVLLGLGRRTTMLYDAAAPARHGHSLMDLIALAYVREAERLASHGLIKAYERRTFTRPPYPGVPAATAHLKIHAGRPDRLATTANRLTVDVPLNQLVAAAHRRLLCLTYKEEQLTTRLRAIAPVFHHVTSPIRPIPRIDTVPARYREIHDLARLILDEQTTLPTGSGVTGVSVLFNMTKIWEEYVGRWLHDQWPDAVVSSQHRIPLTDNGPDRSVHADFVIYHSGRPVAVYDAKYRPWHPWPRTDEVYQLFTYAHRLGVNRAALIYPGPEARYVESTIDNLTIETRAIPVT